MSDETMIETHVPASNGASNGALHEAAAHEPAAAHKRKRKHKQRDNQAITTPPASATTATDPPSEVPAEPAIASPLPSAEPPAEELPQQEVVAEDLRLRMKIWTDHQTGKRYLMPTAFMRDIVNGQPVTDVMYAYAMRDDDTKLVTLTAREWNTLPFCYFREDGPAPRAVARALDVVSRRRGMRGAR